MKNIFLSDDDADDCMLFSEVFDEIVTKQEGNLTIVNDGLALMQRLEDTVPQPPEVIFLDINMPKKNGFECLQEIRQHPKLSLIPVIIFSTSNNNDIIDKMYTFGANYYICKPPTYPLFKKAIETVLSLDWNLLLNQHPSRESFMIKVA